MAENKISKHTIRRLRSSYITTVVSITLVMFLFSIIALLLLNTKKLSDYVKENIGISVIIKDKIKDADKIWLQKSLLTAPYVKSAKLITKEEAAEDLKKQLGEDFVGFLGYNPLLPSIEIRLNASWVTPDSINSVKKKLLKFDEVKEVIYQELLIHNVTQNVKKITMFVALFSVFLLIIAIALISNTIRLSIYANRLTIKTMQLVGATDAFIRRPFLMKSIIYGIVGATFALILLYFIIYVTLTEFDNVVTISNVGLLSIMTLITGFALSWISAYVAVNKYLHININQLYY